MSTLRFRSLRALGGVALAAGCALAGATSAQATAVPVSATCAFPKIGDQVVTFDFSYPDNLVSGDSVPAGKVTKLKIPAAVSGLGAKVELLDSSWLKTTTHGRGAPTSTGVGLAGTLPLPPELYGGMWTFGAGDTTGKINALTLVVRVSDAAGKPVVLPGTTESLFGPGVFIAPCTIAGTPSVTATVAESTGPQERTAPTVPRAVAVSGVTKTSATIRWKASTDAVGVDRYYVSLTDPAGGTGLRTIETTGLEATFTGLKPGTAYRVSVRAIDRAANMSAPATATVRTTAVTPKVTGYSVSGGFTIWVEPATQPGELRQACIVTAPGIDIQGTGFNDVVGGAKLYFQGLWQTKYGYGVPFPGGLLRGSEDSVTYLSDDATIVDSVSALQLVGSKGSVLTADRSGLPSRGRITIVGWYAYAKKVGGITMTIPTFLPAKTAPFAFVDQPAGACTGKGYALLLKA